MLTPSDLKQLAALSCLSLSEQDCERFALSINQLLPMVEHMQCAQIVQAPLPVFATPLRADIPLQDQSAASFHLQWGSALATAHKEEENL